MFSIWLLCVLFCACVALVARARLKAHAYKLPPAHYGSLPIIGITHKFLCDSARLWDFVRQTSEDCVKQGGITISQIGTDTYYFITDPEDALTVANSCLKKHFIYDFIKSSLGDGLLTGAVSIWRRHRKLMNPAFSLPIINGYLEVFNTFNRKIATEIDSYVGKGPFDTSRVIKEAIIAVSCLNVFGTSNLSDQGILQKYMVAVDKLLLAYSQRFQKFYLHSDFIYKLCGEKKKEQILVNAIHKLSSELIQNKKDATLNGLGPKNDLNYKPLIDIIEPLTSTNILTEREFKEELDTTVVAAYETTAITLQCILLLLGTYPEVQERLFQELIQMLGPERDVKKEDIPKLPYTEAVIKETLRYIPIVPVVLRQLEQNIKLKNYVLPEGSYCFILPYGIHRDPVWGADAWEFKPERWLNAEALPTCPGAYAGFSIGKRNCIGKTYAITALKVSLAHLIRKYKIKADYSKVRFKFTLTLKPDKGNNISIQRREKILIE